MLILAVLAVGAAALLVSALGSAALQVERDKKTADALAQAKEALLGYAITYGDSHAGEVHGYLPCPDMDGNQTGNPEGSSELSCGNKNVSVMGRLPWRTLDLPVLRDGSGECLWYIVSGTYKNNPKTDLMNWDNKGLLGVSNAAGGGVQDIAAVIFAPGAVLGSQNRMPSGHAPACGGNYSAANYLDSDGTHNNSAVATAANAISNFFSSASAQINDQIIFITRNDIFNALARRTDFMPTLTAMTQKTAECLAYFGTRNGAGGAGNRSLPWPAPLFLADYGVNGNYNDAANLYAGRVPYRVNDAKAATGNIMGGVNLLTASNCPPGWANIYPWWDNWKDHLFYAIGREFKPVNHATTPCGTCLQVNGKGQYAAVLMFAGKPLATQSRADKGMLGSYLEGRNYGNYPNPAGNGNYEVSVASDTFNDILFCIDQNLSVLPCPQ